MISAAGAVMGNTSLAPGADQIFADAILDHAQQLVAVLPVFCGHVELEDGAKPDFDRLCARACEIIRVKGDTPDDAFMRAGKRVVDESDQMIFVWDGAPSRGLGGTADVVGYARERRKQGVILDPISRTITPL